jgi:peptidoglycan hydrolase CwlO-like protein
MGEILQTVDKPITPWEGCGNMKKLMLKTKIKNWNIKYKLAAFATIGAMVGVPAFSTLVKADQFDDQINSLQQQNNANQQQVDNLTAQANSYQDAINQLQAQIDGLQQNIIENQQKSDQLQAEIDANQQKLEHEKAVLSENIRTMYLEGDTSTLELLASSKDLSDFLNKQEYRNSLSDKLKTTMDTINEIKAELQSQQVQVQSLIKSMEFQKTQLASAQYQQSQLLAYTEGQKAAYNQQISSNQSQIASLRSQQAALNRKLGGAPTAGDPGHGGYPSVWSNATQDSMIDNWGMYNRECVSYAAWKVYQTFGYMPYWGGVGNANQWPGDAVRAGISIGTTPKAHSVAIWNVGAFGHAMWVEAVSGNTIYVSQYNYDFTGHYSEMSISASGLTFIYFGG